MIQLESAAAVFVAEVKQGDGRLNKPLDELSFAPFAFGPELFENVVRLEEFFVVEEANAFEILLGIVFGHVAFADLTRRLSLWDVARQSRLAN
jgi:hypothetical protein